MSKDDAQESLPVTEMVGQLTRRRERLGWSKSRLAEAAGVDRATLAAIESGSKDYRQDSLRKVTEALSAGEHELGIDAPAVEANGPELIEYEVTGDFGVRVVVRGPVANHEILAGDVARIIRSIQQGDPPADSA